MNTAFRTVAAALVGFLAALAFVVAAEFFSAVVHPFPPDFKGTTEEICRHVERYPHWVLAAVVPIWAAAALVGVWTARTIGNLYSSMAVGLLLLAAVVLNISMLPYPAWFKIVVLIVIPAALFAGSRFSKRRPAAGGSPPLA